MKKITPFLFGLVLAFGTFFIAPFVVDAQGSATGFINATDNPNAIAQGTGGQDSFRSLALVILNYFLGFLGLLAVGMIIYGGFLYIVSAGEDIEKAKKVLLYAGIGIIIILISFALVNTLLGSGTGTQA